MKAFQLVAPGRTELRDVPVPEPGPGEVLLEVAGAGVCHSDLHILDADDWQPLPMTLGHEVCGRIDAVGPGVAGWDRGAVVLAYLCWGCGMCRTCASGHENYCESYGRGITPGPGLGFQGCMAEYAVIPARFLVPLGELDPVEAAPLADAGLTPFHAVGLVRDRLSPKATAVVVGVGGLGHLGLQILDATTGARIIAVDVDDAKLAHARELGAAEAVPSDAETVGRVLHLTRGRGADAVFDFVGTEETLAMAAEAVAPFGRIVVVGMGAGVLPYAADAPPGGLPWGAAVLKPYAGTRADLHDVVALARRGEIAVHVERYPLADAPAVFDRLAAGRVAGRAVLVP